MNIIQNARQKYFFKKIAALIAEHSKKRRQITHNFWSARQIAILFDAENDGDRSVLLELARSFEKEGKIVHLLGYFDDAKKAIQFSPKNEKSPFPIFSKKETSWLLRRPNLEIIDSFSKKTLDLLLVFNPAKGMAIEWLTAMTHAAMKIGTATNCPNDLDLALGLSDQRKSAVDFLKQLDQLFDKIVLTNAHHHTTNSAVVAAA